MSPVLANLFMHYAFDMWMQREYPNIPWCRYADDGVTHCRNEAEAQEMLDALKKRFAECGLELHPVKTRIVYCKDGNREGQYPNKKLDFLGFGFRSRGVKNKKRDQLFSGFTPGVSDSALKSMRAKIRELDIRNRSDLSLGEIAEIVNPLLQGWINYYGRFYPSALYPLLRHMNMTLVEWVMRKYRRFKRDRRSAVKLLDRIWEEQPTLFVHWRCEMRGLFA